MHGPPHQETTCPVCGVHRPEEDMVPGQMVRSHVAELAARKAPGWTPDQSLCRSCLDQLRSEYVEDVLEEERGDLDRVEQDVVRSFRELELISADVNEEFERRLSVGERLADGIAEFGGSWTFIVIFGAVLLGWIAINSFALLHRPFDPFPYILLNLVLSCLAAIQAPVIMMSQNRQESKDRLRSENDYKTNLKAELEIRHINEKLDLLLTRQWKRLLEIQQIQLELMREISDQGRNGR